MQGLHSRSNLNEYRPNGLLIKESIVLLMMHDLLVEITIINVFHDDTQGRGGVFEERVLVSDDVRVSEL